MLVPFVLPSSRSRDSHPALIGAALAFIVAMACGTGVRCDEPLEDEHAEPAFTREAIR
jgi:hypothetical protein